MEAKAVQESLKSAFERWGRPQAMRFDNGRPWANPQSRVPSGLALWLKGLGVGLLFGRPRQCTDNGVVERVHGVLNAWVEPQTCRDREELARRLETFSRIQREAYLACEGGKRTRQQAYPSLWRVERPYRREDDQGLWQVSEVLAYVASFQFSRRVEKNGRIGVMTHEYPLGKAYAGEKVTVQLDPRACQWQIKNRHGEVLKVFPAQQFDYDTIAAMQMTYKHFKTKPTGVFKGA